MAGGWRSSRVFAWRSCREHSTLLTRIHSQHAKGVAKIGSKVHVIPPQQDRRAAACLVLEDPVDRPTHASLSFLASRSIRV